MNISEQRQALREGLAEQIPDACEICTLECTVGIASDTPAGQGDICAYQYAKADSILAYLHSQGLVFKVKGGIPEEPKKQMKFKSLDFRKGWLKGMIDIVTAGHTATAPIIEET